MSQTIRRKKTINKKIKRKNLHSKKRKKSKKGKTKFNNKNNAIHIRLAMNIFKRRRKEKTLRGRTIWKSRRKVELDDPILKNFTNHKLSTSNYGVYINEKEKHIVFSIRGTDLLQSPKDLYYDYKILKGDELKIKYYKKAHNLLKKIIHKYNDYKITLTGCSLGGRIAINLLDSNLGDNIHAVYAFNPATAQKQIYKSNECKLNNPKWCDNRKKLKIFLVNGDIISSLASGEKAGYFKIFKKHKKALNNHDSFTFFYNL